LGNFKVGVNSNTGVMRMVLKPNLKLPIVPIVHMKNLTSNIFPFTLVFKEMSADNVVCSCLGLNESKSIKFPIANLEHPPRLFKDRFFEKIQKLHVSPKNG
jgi:hypothetical protein